MQSAYGRQDRYRHGAQRRTDSGKYGTDSLRFVQLLVCMILFLAVFVGKGVFPAKLAQTGERLLRVIRTNTDFRAAFSGVGQALAQQDSVLGELGEFCVAVFGPAPEPEPEEVQILPPIPAEVMRGDILSASADQNRMTAAFLGMDTLPEQLKVTLPGPQETVEPEPQALEVGAVIQLAEETGETLPEHYSKNWLYLGDMETMTPVLGRVTSGFGYRDHPTKGVYAPHGGVDIGANTGTPVAAYADGVVEYIGKNDDFGLYLRLIHENGVKTFYAHCSKLYVQKGDQVHMGDTIALVGATGQTTGPHLHFEIIWNGTRLDPTYYIDTNGAR